MDRPLRIDVIVMGRILGTASGWDEVDDWTPCFYDFVPNDQCEIEAGLLTVTFTKGTYQLYDIETEEVKIEGDIVPIIAKIASFLK